VTYIRLLVSLRLLILFIVRNSKYLENATFWKLVLFQSSGEGADTYSVGSLRKSRSSFPNDVFSSYK
jgi:hypothetical protein